MPGRSAVHASPAARLRLRTVGAMIEVGVPGAYVRTIRATHLRNVALLTLVGACATGGALFFLAASRLGPAVVSAAISAVSVALGRAEWSAVRRAQAGLSAEQSAAESLRRGDFAVLVFGATLERGDCDAVVIGPQLVAVEVKHGTGEVQAVRGGLIVRGKPLRKDPVRQARAQAAAIRRRCGVYTDAVVCVTQMSNQPFQADGVWVCSARDLATVAGGLPGRVTRFQAATIAGQLSSGEPAKNP